MWRNTNDGHQGIRLGLYISAECEQRVLLLLLPLPLMVMLLVTLGHGDRRFVDIVFGVVTGLRDYTTVQIQAAQIPINDR